jgi:site-specific recombinase XerD
MSSNALTSAIRRAQALAHEIKAEGREATPKELATLEQAAELAERVWVSADIGKGHKERWVPVIADLELVWREIAKHVGDDEYVLPAQRFRDPGINRQRTDYSLSPASEQAIWRLVRKVVERAGIPAKVTPHTLRHAYCDHVARHAGLQVAQQAMGHANLATTELYLGQPTLDEIATAMRGVTLGAEQTFQVPEDSTASAVEAPTGIEPVYTALQAAAYPLRHGAGGDLA